MKVCTTRYLRMINSTTEMSEQNGMNPKTDKGQETFPRPPSLILHLERCESRNSTRTSHATSQLPGKFPPVSTTFSTITVRVLSFQGQMLTGVTPLQLAKNGFYCQPCQGLGDLACCFAWKSAKRLDILKRAPFKAVQQIHLADCIWQVIYPDLEHHFGNFLTATASPSLRQSTSSSHFSSDGEQPETTIAQSSIQS